MGEVSEEQKNGIRHTEINSKIAEVSLPYQ